MLIRLVVFIPAATVVNMVVVPPIMLLKTILLHLDRNLISPWELRVEEALGVLLLVRVQMRHRVVQLGLVQSVSPIKLL